MVEGQPWLTRAAGTTGDRCGAGGVLAVPSVDERGMHPGPVYLPPDTQHQQSETPQEYNAMAESRRLDPNPGSSVCWLGDLQPVA